MWTRYKYLKYKLTGNRYYDKAGNPKEVKDSSEQISDYTPHNVKALFIDSHGAIVVHFVAHSNRPKIEWVNFESVLNEESKEQYMKDEVAVSQGKPVKGVFDALYDGVVFNFIEELFVFGDKNDQGKVDICGYEKPDYYSFYRLKDRGMNHFPALKNIYVMHGSTLGLINAFQEAKKAGQPFELDYDSFSKLNNVPICKVFPDRTIDEQNAPKLNSAKYKLDTPYAEGDKTTEDNRLAKYFLDRKKQEKEAEKNKEANKRKQMLESMATEMWDDVKEIYADLYKNSIEYGCLGILTPSGLLQFNEKDNTLRTNNSPRFKALFDSFVRYGKNKGFKIANTQKLKDITSEDFNAYNYFERFHALNAFGFDKENVRKKSWDDVEKGIKYRFVNVAKAFLSNATDEEMWTMRTQIINKLTNCVVVEAFDTNKAISIKYKLENINEAYADYFSENCNTITGKQNCRILSNDTSENNVTAIFGIFNFKKFSNEALFSYQAYEKHIELGKPVNLGNTIIGRSIEGSNKIVSLVDGNTLITGIFAGSGAGKGVMTLGLLSSIISNKAPFIYLDYKPDMAKMLWNVEREFATNGITCSDGSPCKILAIDSNADCTETTPVRGHIFGENLPEYVGLQGSVFKVIPYLKLMQLYYLLAYERKLSTESQNAFGGRTTFAIFDELQENVFTSLDNLEKQLKFAYDEAKKSKAPNLDDLTKYMNKFNLFKNQLGSESGEYANTNARKGQTRTIFIGQSGDYNVWAKSSITETLYKKVGTRIFGRNCGTGSYVPDKKGVVNEFIYNENTFGYWTTAVGGGKVDSKKDWTVFKAYSVLNENDFNMEDPMNSGPYTTGVLNNTKDEDVKKDLMENVFVMTDTEGNKVIREEVGFLGLIKKLSHFSDSELADALSSGYYLIWKLMCKYGLDSRYEDVESYLFDCSLESIFTSDELKTGISAVGPQISAPITKAFDEDDEEVDIFGDSEKKEKPSATPNFEIVGSSEPFNSQRPQRPQRPQPTPQETPQLNNPKQPLPYRQPQQVSGVGNMGSKVYRKPIKIEENPFETYSGTGNTNVLMSMKEITQIIMDDIDKNIGSYSMIKNFKVDNGVLYFNNIAYQPQFESSFVESIPMALQQAINEGRMLEFFDLGKVYKYPNLETFEILDEKTAQGRARKEMGIGFRKRWNVLFRKFRYLNYIKVGAVEYSATNPDNDGEDSWLDKFMNNKISTYSTDRNSRMDKVWDSKPVRVMANAFGWTMGVKAVWLAASLFGPIGLLFGAFAAVGAVKEYKTEKRETGQFFPMDSKKELKQKSSQEALPSSTKKKKRKDKKKNGFSPLDGK